MQDKLITNLAIAQSIRPLYPALEQAFEIARRDVVFSGEIIPNKRKTERANDMHAAVRESLRFLCDEFDLPWLELIEEPEGLGLDCLLIKTGEASFALRWGKYDGVRIRRNSTKRQSMAQEQMLLCGGIDSELDGLPVATMGYTIEDDHYASGIPQWWVGRVALIRERVDESDFIEDVAVFSQPHATLQVDQLGSPRLVARQSEQDDLGRLLHEIRRRIA